MPLELTWRCHVCGEERADDLIGTAHGWTNVGGVVLLTSARFCKDTMACRIGAFIMAADWMRLSIGHGR